MKFIVLLLLGSFGFFNAFSQKPNCTCEALFEYEHRSAIPIFDKPNGKVIYRVKPNLKAEDYLLMTIDREQSSFFYGKVAYAISGKSYHGWVRKSTWLGTYARNYGGAELLLYQAPALSAPVKTHVPGFAFCLYSIRHCACAWVYVRLIFKGRAYEGWLPPAMQCANPYTTCS
ncbi:hypothetical protein [Hymenobacter psoromatis]|uniref:hypothetical protein n=1 Tax=Hymenobacter psoromatis TaxID=1484116 RepID=UPI001CBCB862|nr:hypothetical protein [Hymenobacter psoromatis]